MRPQELTVDCPSVQQVASLDVAALPAVIAVPPVTGPFALSVRPPGSKSLTNRAILIASLARGTSVIDGALTDADDAQRMLGAVRLLGAGVQQSGTTLRITGVDGRWRQPPGGVTLDLGNAGTATRFLAAAAILGDPACEPITIDGNARMRQRPIAELGDALVQLGVGVEYRGQPGYPPMRVVPPSRLDVLKPTVTFGRTQSSQFISAVLLTAPHLPLGLTVRVQGEATSASYVRMSLGLMRRVGIQFQQAGEHVYRTGQATPSLDAKVPHQTVRGFEYFIEPDASGATYFQAAGALVPGASVRIEGLSTDTHASLQADVEFLRVIELAGARVERDGLGCRVIGPISLRAFEHDFSDIPDTAMTAAVLACFAHGTSTLTGLRTLRVKETDRVAALVTELTKIGVRVESFGTGSDEGLRLTPPAGGIDRSPEAPRVEFDTYDDHRMAMSLALIGLVRPNVFIRDPGCVAKTYAGFWRELARVY